MANGQLPTFEQQVGIKPTGVSDAPSKGFQRIQQAIGGAETIVTQKLGEQKQVADALQASNESTDAMQHLEKLKVQAETTSQDPTVQAQYFTQGVADYRQVIMPTLKSGKVKVAVNGVINSAALTGSKFFAGKQEKQNQAVLITSYLDNIEKLNNAQTSAELQGNPELANFAHGMSVRLKEQALANGFITATQFKKSETDDKVNLLNAKLQKSTIDTVNSKGPGQALEMLKDLETKGIDEVTKTGSVTSFGGASLGQFQTAINKAHSTINTLNEGNLTSASATGETTSDYLDSVRQTGKRDLAKEATLKRSFPIAKQDSFEQKSIDEQNTNSQAVRVWTTNNAGQRQQALSDLKDSDFTKFKKVQTLVRGFDTQWEKDKFVAMQRNPAIEKAEITQQFMKNGISDTDASLRAEQLMTQSPTQANLMAQRLRGAKESELQAIPADEAVDQGNFIKTSTATHIQQRLLQLKSQLGKNYSIGLNNIISGTPNFNSGFAIIAGMSPTDPHMSELLNAWQTYKEGNFKTTLGDAKLGLSKEEKSDLNSFTDVMGFTSTAKANGFIFTDYPAIERARASVVNSSGNQKILAKEKNGQLENFSKLAITFALKQGHSVKDAKGFVNSSLDASNNFLQKDTFWMALPKQVNGAELPPKTVGSYIDRYRDEVIDNINARDTGTPSGLGSAVDNIRMRQEIENGHTRSKADGTGIEFVDAKNNVVIDNATGQPVEFNWKEALTDEDPIKKYNIDTEKTTAERQKRLEALTPAERDVELRNHETRFVGSLFSSDTDSPQQRPLIDLKTLAHKGFKKLEDAL